jgi:hypothetical protein
VSPEVNIVGLAATAFGAFVLIRMLRKGGASADGEGFRRDEQPALFWTIFSAGVFIECGFLYLTFFY